MFVEGSLADDALGRSDVGDPFAGLGHRVHGVGDRTLLSEAQAVPRGLDVSPAARI